MEWFVYHYNINKHEIEAFNIFKHGSFAKYCNIHLNTMSDKKQFANAIKDELRYYFWSKSEYELIVRLPTMIVYSYSLGAAAVIPRMKRLK